MMMGRSRIRDAWYIAIAMSVHSNRSLLTKE